MEDDSNDGYVAERPTSGLLVVEPYSFEPVVDTVTGTPDSWQSGTQEAVKAIEPLNSERIGNTDW
jgi:hypothetical protein